uniref:Uncharacterized protein n=1 Tax=Anguilla anguilla TaxID=7936 RepID=A0A0E9R8P5_ANGAN
MLLCEGALLPLSWQEVTHRDMLPLYAVLSPHICDFAQGEFQ